MTCIDGKLLHGCSAEDGRDSASGCVSQPTMIEVIWPTGKTAAHCAADSLERILCQQKADYPRKSPFHLILTQAKVLLAHGGPRRKQLWDN